MCEKIKETLTFVGKIAYILRIVVYETCYFDNGEISGFYRKTNLKNKLVLCSSRHNNRISPVLFLEIL